ncbi:MAG: diaminopimelate decarboxylase [bacterium]|nr:diaminopimelate decarboxylase [bacterium]
MNYFQYNHNELYAEEVPVREIVSQVGTPVYIYSYKTLERHFKAYDSAFGKIDHLVCFAVKANSNLAILNLLGKLGAGADIVSGGELHRALKAGISPEKIVYAGVGKMRSEMEMALRAKILMFNVESWPELEFLNQVAGELGVKATVAWRVNPDIAADTHPYISTGLRREKFGLDIHQAISEYKKARRLKNIDIAGIHVHIGSQITQVSPFVDSLIKVIDLIRKLDAEGIGIRFVDIGGGLGITYRDEVPPSPQEFLQAISPVIEGLGVKIISEPGRVIVGNAGILVTQVLYVKRKDNKNFLIVDAGMNDLIRPSLYKAYHEILPVCKREERPRIVADVVGPICESGDFLARDRELPEFVAGELMSVMSAGAYGFAMSSNYNSRPRVAEVLVRGDQFSIIRERETYEDLIRGESIPAW